MLAPPTSDAMTLIKRRAPNGVVEVGAGDGAWLEAMTAFGIYCVGYDQNPREPLVLQGGHNDAARHPEMAFLAVWPPDGDKIDSWIAAYRGNIIMIVASFSRLFFSRRNLQEVARLQVPAGPEGPSRLIIFHRIGESAWPAT